MKKLKLRRKQAEPTSTRITNDTVAEHREKILAGGRRYKYPLQYAKHKLVINAVIVAFSALVVLLALGWWQLYVVQNSSTFFYRITQAVPLPIASVDGASAKYSDYLLYYRPSEYYLNKYDEIKSNSEDGRLQLDYKKRDALDRAIADAYARTVAKQHNLSVTRDEVTEAITSLRESDDSTLTIDAVNASAQRVFGMTEQDTRSQYRNSLLRSRAAFAIDDRARQTVKRVQAALKSSKDLSKVADQINKAEEASVEYGMSGLVNQSTIFSGLNVGDIADLEDDKIHGPLKTATDDGYYFVEVVERNDTQISFAFLRVPLTEFKSRIAKFKEDGKITEYITISIDQPEPGKEDN